MRSLAELGEPQGTLLAAARQPKRHLAAITWGVVGGVSTSRTLRLVRNMSGETVSDALCVRPGRSDENALIYFEVFGRSRGDPQLTTSLISF